MVNQSKSLGVRLLNLQLAKLGNVGFGFLKNAGFPHCPYILLLQSLWISHLLGGQNHCAHLKHLSGPLKLTRTRRQLQWFGLSQRFGHGSPIKTGFSHGPCILYSHVFPKLRNNLTGKMRKRVPNPVYSCFSPKIFPCISHIAEPSGFGGTFQTNLHQERCYSWIFILQNRYWRFSSPIPHEEP